MRSDCLFQLLGANFQSTADQQFTTVYNGSAYCVTDVVCRQRSGACSVACLGGIYDQASKGGNIIVAAAQSWLTLASGIMVRATLTALTGTAILANTPFLSLTTGSTAACSGDVFIYGWDMS